MTSIETDVRWLDEAEMEAWRAYVIGSELLRQQLNRELQDRHGLALVDYEVLVRLSEQEDHQMRMSQLAGMVASSKSRVSHQIARLEAAGLVRRRGCTNDARGVYAELTDRGAEHLRDAAPTHVHGVRRHLISLLTASEQAMLAAIFERVLGHLGELEGSTR